MTQCPCCGTEVADDRPLVSLDTNMFAYREREVRLAPQCAEILYVLVQKWPGKASRLDILNGMYGVHIDQAKTADRVLSVRIAEIRRAISCTGVKIVNLPWKGYRLVLPTQAH